MMGIALFNRSNPPEPLILPEDWFDSRRRRSLGKAAVQDLKESF